MNTKQIYKTEFSATADKRVDSIKIVWKQDESPDTSYLGAYQRSERLNAGDWCYMGCYAEAEVSYPTGGGNRRLETLRSGGLWGIESDSDAKYAGEVEGQELADLKGHLSQFGIGWPEFEPVLSVAA